MVKAKVTTEAELHEKMLASRGVAKELVGGNAKLAVPLNGKRTRQQNEHNAMKAIRAKIKK